MIGYECKTLYAASAGVGYQILFSKGKWLVSVLSNGGTMWIRPRSPLDASGTTPTIPIPAAGAIADGWLRLLDGQIAEFGRDPTSTATEGVAAPGVSVAATLVEQIAFLDVWCEVQGDLIVNAH